VADWLDPAGIGTARLLLRAVADADLPALERSLLDPEVRRYLGGPVGAGHLAARRAAAVGERGTFAVTTQAGGQVVGFCYLGRHRCGAVELSYTFLPEHWGHGYAREAAAAVLAWGFASVPGCERIVAVTQTDNARSRRLLRALGMRPVEEFVEFGAPQVMYEARAALRLLYETHATTTDNEAGVATGRLPGRLSATGREQARELGRRRRGEVDLVLVSDLGRALETVELAFGGGVPVRRDARLRECDYGARNGTPVAEIDADRARHLDDPYPGGESYRQVVERTRELLGDLVRDHHGARVLLVAHRANRWALDCLLHGNLLEELLETPFRWRAGWRYLVPAGWGGARGGESAWTS
jgi:RimJ/RimL family protein N-acetyltransferase